jgi:hypothetical protein
LYVVVSEYLLLIPSKLFEVASSRLQQVAIVLQRRRYVALGFIVDEEEDAVACILACLWFPGSCIPVD